MLSVETECCSVPHVVYGPYMDFFSCKLQCFSYKKNPSFVRVTSPLIRTACTALLFPCANLRAHDAKYSFTLLFS